MNKLSIFSILMVMISYQLPNVIASNATDNIETKIINALETIITFAGFEFSNGTEGPPPPIEEDIGFWLISRTVQNLTRVYMNNPTTTALIDPKLKTVFMYHGWTSNITYFEIYAAKKWLKRKDYNMILVDWKRLGSADYFTTSYESVPKVSDFSILFIRHLTETISLSLGDIILLGHSSGGQIAGLIGHGFNGLIGQIYALDPGGPLFTIPQTSPEKHLDKTDAKYVECLHTACATEGTPYDCGHVDVYVNGGAIQPGCYDVPTPGFISCSHNRAVKFFLQGLDPDTALVITKCPQSTCEVKRNVITNHFKSSTLIYLLLQFGLISEVEHLSDSGCTEGETVHMDFDGPKPHGSYYLTTSSTAPYCLYC